MLEGKDLLTMPTIEECQIPYDVREYCTAAGSTGPGVVIEAPSLRRTNFGTSAPSSLASWERQRLLSALTEWLNDLLRCLKEHTGSKYIAVLTTAEGRSLELPAEKEFPSPSHEDQIATIRSALSLQIKELAEAVHVERPTVYSWINGRNTPQPNNRERLHAIFHLAQRWTQLTNKPLGKALHAVDVEGKSLFTLMREDPIPTAPLLERFRATARAVDQEPSEDPTSVRQLARKHNFDLSRVADHQDDIDLETGKRIFAD